MGEPRAPNPQPDRRQVRDSSQAADRCNRTQTQQAVLSKNFFSARRASICQL